MLPQYPPQPYGNSQSSRPTHGNGVPSSISELRASPSSSSIAKINNNDKDMQRQESGPPFQSPSIGPGQLQRRNTFNVANGTDTGSDTDGTATSRPRADSEAKPGTGPSAKKRARRPSNINLDRPTSPPNSKNGSTNGKKPKASAAAVTSAASAAPDSPPAVLVREKKQKACSNCRRAKLKCIVEDGEADCVRCKARKERCVFYPRTHDEDWQQMLSSDVYTALNHLSTLSSTVHHILHHLSAQRIIPPLPTTAFEVYEPPERDTSILQGWTAERNRELGSEEGRKKRKSTGGREEEEDEVSHPTHSSGGWNFSQPTETPFYLRMPSGSAERNQWANGNAGPPPPTFEGGPNLSSHHDMPPNLPYPLPSPSLTHRSGHGSELAPIRHPSAHSILLSPTVETDQYQNPPFFNGPPYLGPHDPRMLPPPPPAPPSQIPPGPGSGPGSAPRDLSPLNPQNATPSSVVHSSPSNTHMSQSETSWQFVGSQQGDQNTLSGSKPMHLYESRDGVDSAQNRSFEGMPSGPPPSVGPDEEVYGSADGRETIITKNIIPPAYARTLVDYFHSAMSPFLFGYHLQLKAFPYLPEGPTHITPFILAVECLLASERIPNLYVYHDRLADAVLNMLMTSPAESWQTIQGSREIREAKAKEQVLGKAFDGDTTDWDAELGIGPEEIVAACTLATFIGQKEHARHIAQYAFMWVRGWTSYLKEPGATFAEATGLVTPLRRPSEPDMARVWLLSYIVFGQETLQATDVDLPPLHDPMRWARVLLPETAAPSGNANPHDVLLVFHARLIALLLDWQRARSEVGRSDPATSNSSFDAAPSPSYSHKRLASRLNASLDWWQDDLKAYRLDEAWTRQIQLDYLHAKILVNSTASKNIWGGVDEDRLREANRAFVVDAAYQLLRRCIAWSPPEAMTNLPQAYLRMIASAANEVVEALAEVQNGSLSRSACSVTVKEVVPVLASLGNMLFLGGLPANHGCRTAGHVLRQHVENLNRLTMG
ncbi:hypothetical protein BD324DRAFT_626030 [Kockovaella imperatae]|uniref:Zn(2)-C6 fungal-type domain-containing protein n=1 Tax=Kockovaella imperatae TaxID=4999 RepID=A0A1Y1UH65_9TREE|nr:hypothetical protein BD324DRAFT_626030 [Kockovaella imperatae]ORX37401.1 hypothetical protein BD324DRAFT_626030 [Kockovaella imperatae]